MKLIAILRDSVREAIDAKIFYVLLGLSTLLILLCFTVTFEPVETVEEVPGENKETSFVFMQMATGALNVDLGENQLELTEKPQNLWKMLLNPKRNELYELKSTKAIEGAQNRPDSTYEVILQVHFVNNKALAEALARPERIRNRIREKFGNVAGARLIEVRDVQVLKSDKKEQTQIVRVVAVPTGVTYRMWPHRMKLFFGLTELSFIPPSPLGAQLLVIEDQIINTYGSWVAVLVSVIVTAFFVPNMLQKGTIEPLLVKPIRRWQLLIYKYVGGLTFIFVTSVYTIGGVWLALSLRSGVWPMSFLLLIPGITFYFAILYSGSVLFGVLTRSPVTTILLTCALWFGLFLVGTGYKIFETLATDEGRNVFLKAQNRPVTDDGLTSDQRRERQGWFADVVRGLHKVLPRTRDLDELVTVSLRNELLFNSKMTRNALTITPKINWTETLGVSGAFIAVMLGLACLRFCTKDY